MASDRGGWRRFLPVGTGIWYRSPLARHDDLLLDPGIALRAAQPVPEEGLARDPAGEPVRIMPASAVSLRLTELVRDRTPAPSRACSRGRRASARSRPQGT